MNIEGVEYDIEWGEFKPGYSFFIPCLRLTEASKDIKKAARRLNIDVTIMPVIEDGYKGVRVWHA